VRKQITREAHGRHSYTPKEIITTLDFHYTVVSKVINGDP